MEDEKLNLRKWLFNHRYGFLLFALVYALVGFELFSLFLGRPISQYLSFVFLVLAGVNLMADRKLIFFLSIPAGILVLLPEFIFNFFQKREILLLISFPAFFAFFIFMAIELFSQILRNVEVDFKVIVAAFAGYFLIGILAFFTYSFIQIIFPNAFNVQIIAMNEGFSDLFYFSFVSLTTIGFGDIVPVIPLAKRMVIFFGLAGQFYLAVIVAILVGKFLSQANNNAKKS